MTIAEFIRESVLRPRLKQAGALVVYDADKRYREQCFDLAADKVRVVDASESSIERITKIGRASCRERV